jgi:RNA-directed DNA polymerase
LHLHRHLCRGYTDVVDADLSRYFDSIPHSELLKSVARRVVDRNVLRLIKMRLKAPTEERDGSDGHRPQAPAPIFDSTPADQSGLQPALRRNGRFGRRRTNRIDGEPT